MISSCCQFLLLALALTSIFAFAQDKPVEVHDQLLPKIDAPMRVTLTRLHRQITFGRQHYSAVGCMTKERLRNNFPI
jgi:hypothetical protein